MWAHSSFSLLSSRCHEPFLMQLLVSALLSPTVSLGIIDRASWWHEGERASIWYQSTNKFRETLTHWWERGGMSSNKNKRGYRKGKVCCRNITFFALGRVFSRFCISQAHSVQLSKGIDKNRLPYQVNICTSSSWMKSTWKQPGAGLWLKLDYDSMCRYSAWYSGSSHSSADQCLSPPLA